MTAIPHRLNALLLAALAAANGALLFALPFLVRDDPRWAWAAVAIALSSSTLWSLVHEAIHGLAARTRAGNERFGRVAAVAFGAPFAVLRAGHLLHHRYSRTVRERTEVYDAARTSRARAALAYYPRLLGGMYLAEAAASLAALLPAGVLARLERRLDGDDTVAGLVVRALRQPGVLVPLRVDAVAIVALYGASFWLYGTHAWVLGLALALRAFLISFADNACHYATALDRPRAAKNVRAPRWLEAALLNFTLHGVHHRHPALPWPALRRRFAADGLGYDEPLGRCLARQLRGPLAASSFGPA
jgi:fatty acid desaturase